MIRPAQLKLIERAREAVASDPAEFAGILRRCGGVDDVEALTAQGFARLMDHFTIIRFQCRQRPILSATTRKLIEATAQQLGLSAHVYAADLRGYGGVADLRDLVGLGLIDLLARWEQRGLDVAAFVAARRTITLGKVRLIQVARKRNAMDEKRYYGMLQGYGGVVSANDLDGRGFDLCMAFLEAEGFERQPLVASKPSFGRRPGFASPEQVELIRALWSEWSGNDVEAELNGWLERYYRASTLRFLNTSSAGKAIRALKAMKGRAHLRSGPPTQLASKTDCPRD